jgi:hypothetical protein
LSLTAGIQGRTGVAGEDGDIYSILATRFECEGASGKTRGVFGSQYVKAEP